MKNILALIFSFLTSTYLYSQTTTVDYSYEELNSNCNVFGTELTIDNIKHQSTKGSPKFDAVNFFVKLACQRASSGQILGTEYQIIYPFKKNYRYQISIEYQGAVTNTQTELYPVLAVKLNVTKKSQNTNCVGPVAVASSDYSGFASSGSSLAWVINIIDGTMLVDHESLSIAALPWTGGTTGVQQVMIRKIQIVEILPGPVNDNYTGAISLTPSSSSTCVTQVNGTTVNATQSPQPAPSCNASVDDDVWYKFVATDTKQSINISDVSYQGAGGLGYGIAVYNSALTLIGCVNLENKLVNSTFVIGQTYYIRLWTSATSTTKRMNFKICVTKPPSNLIHSVSLTYPNGISNPGVMIANYLLESGIPTSDIDFVWSLVPAPNTDWCGGSGLDILKTGWNQASLITIQPDCAALVRVRMKRKSTNTYIADYTSEWIAYGN